MPAPKRGDLVGRTYQDYQMGEVLPDIAAREGVSAQYLWRKWKAKGWPLRKRGWAAREVTPRLIRDVLRYSERGWTVEAICQHLGKSRAMVERIRHHSGFKSTTFGHSEAPMRRTREYDLDGQLVRKWCPACSRMRQVGWFHANSSAKDGLQHQCKSCQDARRRAGRAS